MNNFHLTNECYYCYLDVESKLKDVDEICEQLWAEIKIMKTLRVRDLCLIKII